MRKNIFLPTFLILIYSTLGNAQSCDARKSALFPNSYNCFEVYVIPNEVFTINANYSGVFESGNNEYKINNKDLTRALKSKEVNIVGVMGAIQHAYESYVEASYWKSKAILKNSVSSESNSESEIRSSAIEIDRAQFNHKFHKLNHQLDSDGEYHGFIFDVPDGIANLPFIVQYDEDYEYLSKNIAADGCSNLILPDNEEPDSSHSYSRENGLSPYNWFTDVIPSYSSKVCSLMFYTSIEARRSPIRQMVDEYLSLQSQVHESISLIESLKIEVPKGFKLIKYLVLDDEPVYAGQPLALIEEERTIFLKGPVLKEVIDIQNLNLRIGDNHILTFEKYGDLEFDAVVDDIEVPNGFLKEKKLLITWKVKTIAKNSEYWDEKLALRLSDTIVISEVKNDK